MPIVIVLNGTTIGVWDHLSNKLVASHIMAQINGRLLAKREGKLRLDVYSLVRV